MADLHVTTNHLKNALYTQMLVIPAQLCTARVHILLWVYVQCSILLGSYMYIRGWAHTYALQTPLYAVLDCYIAKQEQRCQNHVSVGPAPKTSWGSGGHCKPQRKFLMYIRFQDFRSKELFQNDY